MTSRRRAILGYLALFAGALAVRGLHLAAVHDELFFQLRFGDALRYHQWARTIADGDWIGSGVFYQAPLYPYFLAVVYSLFGDGVLAVTIVQSVLGSLACVLLAVAGHGFFKNRRIGYLAGAMLAVYPTAIFFDGIIQKSSLDTVLLCALLATIASARRARGWIAVGVIVGLLALVRENALVFAVLLIAWLAWARRGTAVACLLLGLALMLLPVATRNAAVGGEFHLTTSQLGPNFYIGNHAESDGIYRALRFGRGDPMYESADAALLAEQDVGRDLSPGEVSRYWLSCTLDDIADDPLRWVKLIGRKALLLINRIEVADTEDQYTYAAASPVLRLGAVYMFGALAAMGVHGLIVHRRRRSMRLLALLIAGYALTVVAFYVMARYRYPLAPLLMIPAAAGVIDRRRGQLYGLRVLIVAGIVGLSLLPLTPIAPMRATTLYNVATQLEGERALMYYDGALALDPNYPVALVARGHTQLTLGRIDQAAASYQRAADLQPDFADAYAGLARVSLAADMPGAAEKQWLKALRLDPNLAPAHGDLGVFYASRGLTDQALPHLQKAVQLQPQNAQAHFNLALCLLQTGDRDAAADHARQALQIAPDHPAAARLLADLQGR